MTKNLDIKIRRANPSEAAVLSNIAIRAKRSNGYSDSFMDACRDELTVTAKDVSVGEYWIAETKVIQGFVCLLVSPEQQNGEIHSFFVDPVWQRQGVGILLWKKVMERAKSMNICSIFLNSDPSAVPFYSELGFRVICDVPSGSIAGRMIPRMELDIS